MYTQQEISKQKQAFWTAFGKYMQPILSAEGLPVTWTNYKTGVQGIQFKMDADHQHVSIAISLMDSTQRQTFYNHLVRLKGMLEEALGEKDWNWQPAHEEYGKTISVISKQLIGVSIHRQEDWPAMISFLKPRIIALDEFWSTAKYSFESLT
jgi:hypothetical protein